MSRFVILIAILSCLSCVGKITLCETDVDCVSGGICIDNFCKIRFCENPSEEFCEKGCVNTLTSDEHCGDCGIHCPDGNHCKQGMCVKKEKPQPRPTPQKVCVDGTNCFGDCVDTRGNSKHCGACGNRCSFGRKCEQGKCVLDCGKLSICSGICVNLKTNNGHCGSCKHACKNGTRCMQGKCSCRTGEVRCVGRCANLQTSAFNCGECGKFCKGGTQCRQGRCVCPVGSKLCDKNCVDTKRHKLHCGGCNQVCQGEQVCIEGQCRCKPGTIFCSGKCVDVSKDPNHCGGCDKKCLGENKVCLEGVCGCKKDAFIKGGMCQGVCTDYWSNDEHCGGCGKKCANNYLCIRGSCHCTSSRTTTRYETKLECNGICLFKNTNQNCGGCGVTCSGPLTCRDAAFQTSGSHFKCVCKQGFERDGWAYCKQEDQCFNLKTDPNHCGNCGNQCAKGEVCNNGVCGCKGDNMVLCNGKCTFIGKGADDNCGGCGVKCPGSSFCWSGNPGEFQCVCTTSLARRDSFRKICNDDCVDTYLNDKHCGKCGNECKAPKKCSTIRSHWWDFECTCPNNGKTGYTGRDEVCNGTCVNVLNDVKHCGKCGNSCPNGQVCKLGVCK